MNETPGPTRPSSAKPARDRTQLYVWALIVIVAMTAVIFAASAFSTSHDTSEIPAPSQGAAADSPAYGQALEALRSGDTTKAAALLKSALAANPKDTKAKAKLDEITGSVTGSKDATTVPVDNGSNTTTTPTFDPDAGFTAAVSDLGRLLPRKVDGYDAYSVIKDKKDAELTFSPTGSGPSDVTRALFAVHDQGSKTKAQAFPNTVSRSLYGSNGSTVTVNNVGAYFGGDGHNLYTVSFARGRFAFELTLTVRSGLAPSVARTFAVAAASAFPMQPR